MNNPFSSLGSDLLADRLSLNLLSKSSPSTLPQFFQVKQSRSTTHQNSYHQRQQSHPSNNNIDTGNGSSNGMSKRKGDVALAHVPCKFFKQGTCTAGANCPFSHNQLDPTSESSICKYFLKGNCRFGNKCALVHTLSSSQSRPRTIYYTNAAAGSPPPTVGPGIPREIAYSSSPFRFGSFFSNSISSGSPLLPSPPPPTLQQQQWHLSSPPQPMVLGNIQSGGKNSSSMSGDEEEYGNRGISIPGQRTAIDHRFSFHDDEGEDPFSPFPTGAANNVLDDDVPMIFMQDEELPLSPNGGTQQLSRASQNFAFPSLFHHRYHSNSFPRS